MDIDEFISMVSSAIIDRVKDHLKRDAWMPATVQSFSNDTNVAIVLLDEDDITEEVTEGQVVEGDPTSTYTEAVSVIGSLVFGQRVMVARMPPSGIFVVGSYSNQTWTQFTPEMHTQADGSAYSVGNGARWGRFIRDGFHVTGHYYWRWGTGGTYPAGVSPIWIKLPIPLTSDLNDAPEYGNIVCGHGWIWNGSVSVRHVELSAPNDTGDTSYAYMYLDRDNGLACGLIPAAGFFAANTIVTLHLDYYSA